MTSISPSTKRSRKKVGAGGPEHWKVTRAGQRDKTRSRITSVIASLSGFPTRAAVVKAGKGQFGESSVDRHIDLIDSAQVAANARLAAAGLDPQPLRKSDRRTEKRDVLVEAERERSADLAGRLKIAEAKIIIKDERIAELEERVRRLEIAEVARRRARRGQPVEAE